MARGAAYGLPQHHDHLYVIATSGTDLEATRPMAYGTALVLIVIVLAMNLLASFLRRHFGKKVKTN